MRCTSDRRLARRLGQAAKARVAELNIHWDSVITKLLGVRVLVLSSMVPFSHDATEELSQVLVRNLEEAGFEAEAFRIPSHLDQPSDWLRK